MGLEAVVVVGCVGDDLLAPIREEDVVGTLHCVPVGGFSVAEVGASVVVGHAVCEIVRKFLREANFRELGEIIIFAVYVGFCVCVCVCKEIYLEYGLADIS